MKGRFKRKKDGFFAFDMMEYNPGVGLCQFRLDFHILYVFSVASDFSILAKVYGRYHLDSIIDFF